MKKFFLVSFLSVLLSSVTFAGKPGWLNNGYDKKYPADKYLCGVGIGPALDEARTSARAEIAKIFRTKISQAETNIQEETTLSGKKNVTATATHTAVRTAQTTTAVLEGIEITDTYFDKKRKTYYARAALNRQNAQKILLHQIMDIDEEISKNFVASQKTEFTLEKIPLLVKVLKLEKQQEELTRQRHILNPNYPGEIIKHTDETTINELKKKVRFAFSENTSGEVQNILAEKINAAGFVVVSSAAVSTPAEPVVIVDSQIKIFPAARENPQWKFAGWEINQNLLVGNQNISSRYQKGEESQLTIEAARERARTKAIATAGNLIGEQIQKDIFKDTSAEVEE